MLLRYWNHVWREMSETGRRTFPWDLVRGTSAGALETIRSTIIFLVAIQFFHASVWEKALIGGAHSIGLLLSLPYASWSPVLGRKTRRAALPMFGAGFGLLIAAVAPDTRVYSLGVLACFLCFSLPAPIMTAIYRENYRGTVRGQAVGLAVLITVTVGLTTQFVGGHILDQDLANYRTLFVVLAGLAFLMGAAVLRMPTGDTVEAVVPNPLSSFGAIRENPVFGYVLAAWFLFGFANLALQPQRIEYLSQPEYGFQFSPGVVVLIVGVTTELARLVSIPLWARLFDRFNFIWLRILLCSCFLANTVIYFNSHTVPFLVLACVFLGMGFGGGAITWNLWVTKFSPPEQTARYMSVHTFLTGVRGALAPLVGYAAVQWFSMTATATFGAVLIGLAILLLWRIRHRPTRMA